MGFPNHQEVPILAHFLKSFPCIGENYQKKSEDDDQNNIFLKCFNGLALGTYQFLSFKCKLKIVRGVKVWYNTKRGSIDFNIKFNSNQKVSQKLCVCVLWVINGTCPIHLFGSFVSSKYWKNWKISTWCLKIIRHGSWLLSSNSRIGDRYTTANQSEDDFSNGKAYLYQSRLAIIDARSYYT